MKRSSERILLMLNPASGFISKDIAVSLIMRKLRRHFASVSLVNTRSAPQAREITRRGLKHFDVFVAFGGDGTVNSVAGALVNRDKTLGILPGGSGNGLARNLGLHLSWLRALDTLIGGQDVSIDAGDINGRLFFNVAGMGLDGLISKKFNLESRARGILPYVYFALRGYLEMPQFRVRVATGSGEFEEDILILALANFREYGARAVIAPHASPYDGLLDLCLLKKFNLLQSSLNVQRLFTGTIHKYPFYRTFKFEQAHIRSLNGPIPYHFDGEYGGSELEAFEVRVLPASVRVLIRPVKE
jgi:YegS/Rv2252/BmrU family lipid kinase